MDIVIHIGNHKTGSKTLQRHLFQNLKYRKFLGDPYKPGSHIEELFERIKYQDLLSYNTQRVKELFNDLKNSEIHDTKNYPVLISDESLVTPYLGGKMTADPGLIANRIKDLFGDVKILYVIRSQITMLPSMYSQFVSPEFINQRDFEETIELHLANQLNGMMHGLRYDKICDHYIKLFGKKNIKVIPYELLDHYPKLYYKEICEFINEPIDYQLIDSLSLFKENQRADSKNIAFRKYSLKYERLRKRYKLNRVSNYIPFINGKTAKYLFNYLFFKKNKNLFIPKELENVIYEFFGVSNHRLQEMFNLDLSKYDYPLLSPNTETEKKDDKFELNGWSLRRY
jgi:hypothetical protein